MLMKQLQEEMKCGDTPVLNNNSLNYQITNESDASIDGNIKGRTRDVVILYENTDLDSKLLSDLSPRPRAPNQYVETVVYNGDTDSECSDVSEVYTKEDFRELCMINNETIDFINNTSSENPLCHKHSNIKLKTSGYATDYRRQFSFKNQLNELKNFNVFSSVLPTSLLDYMCCQRPDDDYNFYMDNLITYVQHTIEQLKRISNGEYLTDVAKEKWKETRILLKKEPKNIESRPLSKAVSIPFQDNRDESFNTTRSKSTTHSEMNLKFLNKLLEKKIVLEIPRLFCGSFTLFGKRCQDKLIIQCNKDKKTRNTEKKEGSKMIIALELKNPKLPLSRENSKFILQSFSTIEVKTEPGESSLLSLENKCSKQSLADQKSNVKIVELDVHGKQDKNMNPDLHDQLLLDRSCTNTNLSNDESNGGSISHLGTDELSATLENYDKKEDKTLNTNILACALQKLHAQSPVYEEMDNNQKKKIRSPTRVRIKSPYENKSFVIDEKKRKRLLEIRERREKKKIAMSKNCKISKNKYGQGSIFPQASNSVTKLSITNKSFYNSIYGQTINSYKENKQNSIERKKDCFKLKDNQSYLENLEPNSSIPTSLQSIDNFSHYLDTTDTQVQLHTNEEKTTLINIDAESVNERLKYILSTTGEQQNAQKKETNLDNLDQSNFTENLVPVNSSANLLALECPSKSNLSTECRKSIDKIYDLMKELVKTDDLHTEPIKSQDISTSKTNVQEHVNLITSPSHSSTNVEFSFNHSSHSFGKCLPETSCLNYNKMNSEVATNYPKAIVTSKLQTVKFDEQSIKKNQHKISENPLKAISQLIHRFNDVQKSRKTTHGIKAYKKPEDTKKENKNNSHRSIPIINLKSDRPLSMNRHKDIQILTPMEQKYPLRKDTVKTNQHNLSDVKNNDKVHEKKIADLIDEVKEMRGEAVRGPKRVSRLDTLAQPKKFHFDPHTKEHRIDYGRNIVNKTSHRNMSQIPQKVNSPAIQKNKQKKISDSRSRGLKTNTMPSEEAVRRSASNSPEKRHSPENKNISSTIVHSENQNISTFLKKKSYMTSHFVQAPSKLRNSKIPQKSRVPMVPNDIELASLTEFPSADETTSLGNNLHFMVDEMMNIFPSTLNVVNECDEYLSQSSQISNEASMTRFKLDEVLSGSDYPIDVFEDKNIITAVESTSYPKNINVDVSISSRKHSRMLKSNERTSSSLTALEKIENALISNVGGDNFRSKLRIKNLTPTQSMQQIFVLQSGDTGSLVVKSTLSQKIHTFRPDILTEIHTIQNVSRIPMLCFPVLQSIQYNEPYRRLTNQKIKPESLRKKILEKTSEASHIFNPNNSVSTKNVKYNKSKDDTKSEINTNDFIDINVTESQARSENIDNTTSMDVLVGLLNEIKNISTYQSNVEHKSYLIDNTDTKNIDQECYQKQVSFTALDKLRKLESDPSMYSHYISYDGDWDDNEIMRPTVIINNEIIGTNNNYTDKEITANIEVKEIVHRFTDVPSQLLPTVDQSTSVASIVTLKKRLFGESYECANEYKTIYSNSLYHKDKNTALLQNTTEFNKQSETNNVPYRYGNSEKVPPLTSKLFNSQKNTIIKNTTADPILKLKRDILVIVYSVLVFTVFTALSLPNILRML